MKEFEKWLGPDMCPVEISCPGSWDFTCEECNDLLKAGYKKALKWVLKNCPLSHIGREKIKEELGEE